MSFAADHQAWAADRLAALLADDGWPM